VAVHAFASGSVKEPDCENVLPSLIVASAPASTAGAVFDGAGTYVASQFCVLFNPAVQTVVVVAEFEDCVQVEKSWPLADAGAVSSTDWPVTAACINTGDPLFAANDPVASGEPVQAELPAKDDSPQLKLDTPAEVAAMQAKDKAEAEAPAQTGEEAEAVAKEFFKTGNHTCNHADPDKCTLPEHAQAIADGEAAKLKRPRGFAKATNASV
jgi:hypothetical protein